MFDSIKLHKNTKIDFGKTLSSLISLGYKRKEGIYEQGDFTVKGGNIILFAATFEYPLRIETNADIIEAISSVNSVTFKTIEDHEAVIILPAKKGGFYNKKVWSEKDPIDIFVDLNVGDFVVHVDHGIGRYLGTRVIKSDGTREDCIAIEYQDGDVLYVPWDDMDKVQKYVYFHRKRPRLDKLGNSRWKRAKEKAAKGVFKIANDILEVQAHRERLKGFSYSKDSDWQKRLEEEFPFTETRDQLNATIEVKADMEAPKPMDRLLCGDVGYGKTEVALRAAFKAVMDNRQVAILVPTTILAEQHFSTFTKRMRSFPVNIEMLSRFRKKSEQRDSIKALKDGSVDIVIGTHRLLSEDIGFKNLGLVIIDEEQRFGVRHKERLKRMRMIVDVLTLTATPIPRTLYLALMGGREISVINTPPLERQPVQTEVIEFDDRLIGPAIKREMDRGGQVYFVHNRIDSIDKIAASIKRVAADARIQIGHGQMSEKALEKTMTEFINGRIDILVCTTIIESGIDIPNANTLFVNRAQSFGMADLYQLRGRVGRFTKKAYAYFIVDRIKTLTHDEQRRLDALKRLTQLGSGFKVAMQDLELRGAGNLLGVEQHGYIEQIGFDLYCRLLRNAIEGLKINR